MRVAHETAGRCKIGLLQRPAERGRARFRHDVTGPTIEGFHEDIRVLFEIPLAHVAKRSTYGRRSDKVCPPPRIPDAARCIGPQQSRA